MRLVSHPPYGSYGIERAELLMTTNQTIILLPLLFLMATKHDIVITKSYLHDCPPNTTEELLTRGGGGGGGEGGNKLETYSTLALRLLKPLGSQRSPIVADLRGKKEFLGLHNGFFQWYCPN